MKRGEGAQLPEGAHFFDDPLREAARRVGSRIEAVENGDAENVVPLTAVAIGLVDTRHLHGYVSR